MNPGSTSPIGELAKRVPLAGELVDGLDSLRLLGNDAAHIEPKDFDAIGREALRLAIDVVKEILETVYQHADLVARLAAFKRAQP